jgi:Spy/CpxP family protein refolding chaperone
MKSKVNSQFTAMCLIFSILILLPSLVLAKEKGEEWYEHHKMHRDIMVKDLKLSPEKSKEFMAVEEKYIKSRKEIFMGLKKSREELEKALTIAKPDEAKIKELVGVLKAGQDKIFDSFKAQRDEELNLLTPEQQGHYFLILRKVHKGIVN